MLHRIVDFTDSDLVAIRNSQHQPVKRKLEAENEQYRREYEIANVTAMVIADTGIHQLTS